MITPPHLISLQSYRRLVDIDEPFVPNILTGELLQEALDQVCRFLRAECGCDPRQSGNDIRRQIRSALTVRPPGSLPEAILAALDSWLHHEALQRAATRVTSLPKLEISRPRTRTELVLWQGDITTLDVDVIVNAANDRLLGCFVPFHPCIDNAIHAAAGPRLREDCHKIMVAQGQLEDSGQAKLTRAYHLPSRFVLHTVGPIVTSALSRDHEHQLARCYRACLDVAVETGLIRTIAFCGVSTGLYGFPKTSAARIAFRTTCEWLEEHPDALDRVVFDVYSDSDRLAYEGVIAEYAQ